MSDKKKKPADKAKSGKKTEKDAPKSKKLPAKKLAEIKKQKEEKEREEQELLAREKEEEEKFKMIQLKKEEEERKKKEKKEREKQKRKEKKEKEKVEGTYMTDKEKQKLKQKRAKLNINMDQVGDDETVEEKKKVIYEVKKKKKNNTNGMSNTENVDTNKENDEGNDVTENDKTEENDDSQSEIDNWEDMLESEEEVVEVMPVPVKEKIKEKSVEIEISQDPIVSAKQRIDQRNSEYEAKRDIKVLRSPIVCVLGHVDTGKTKILDKLRHTDVQGGETGGITQQIGATNVPIENIPRVRERISDLLLPGLLIIDTPGHESFSNMRSRGSNLCDLAVLVVDIMHGIQAQTKESIKLLKKRKVPFVIALNKMDRLVEWVAQPEKDIRSVMESQTNNSKHHFSDRYKVALQQFMELGLNIRFFWEEDEQDDYISVVPTSAHSGDGMDDLIAYLCDHAQHKMAKKLSYTEELQASVMEVKETPGHGTTLDVILVNGSLHYNDTIVIGGQEGPIVTKIRYMLQPAPMTELRVKGEYSQQSDCYGAKGVKLVAKGIDKAMPGMPIYRIHNDDEVAFYKNELELSIQQAISGIKLSDKGVYVQTSTIGSLEALLEFLKQQSVPYSGINIGPVHKRDVTRAAIMMEKDPKWAVILAFNVRVEQEADLMARESGVRIFRQDIIYRLHDDMTIYLEQLEREAKERVKDRVIFPVRLSILPDCVFQKRNPILVGVTVEQGTLRMGTPLFARTLLDPTDPKSASTVELGKAMSLEQNHHPVSEVRAGSQVCVRIDPVPGEAPRMLSRHFMETDPIYSKITRESIDLLKKHYRNELQMEDWKLIQDIKPILGIM